MIMKTKRREGIERCLQVFHFFSFGYFHCDGFNNTGNELLALWIVIEYSIVLGILSCFTFDGKIEKFRQESSNIVPSVVGMFYSVTIRRGFISIPNPKCLLSGFGVSCKQVYLFYMSKFQQFFKLLNANRKKLKNRLKALIKVKEASFETISTAIYSQTLSLQIPTMSYDGRFSRSTGWSIITIAQVNPSLLEFAFNFSLKSSSFIFMVQLLTFHLESIPQRNQSTISRAWCEKKNLIDGKKERILRRFKQCRNAIDCCEKLRF